MVIELVVCPTSMVTGRGQGQEPMLYEERTGQGHLIVVSLKNKQVISTKVFEYPCALFAYRAANKRRACCHWLASSHELIAALYTTALGARVANDCSSLGRKE